MSKKGLFFEEDPETAEDTAMTWEEHADSFFGVLKTEGVVPDNMVQDMSPMGAVSEINTKHLKSAIVEIEFGIVREDYVLHVTPIHPLKNLSNIQLYTEALKECVINLNRIVPPDLTVEIHKPLPDWEIKATSFVIRGGASAWNFDHVVLEQDILPAILASVTAICYKA